MTLAMSFSGERNAIQMTREYFLDYSCELDLQHYPFDIQMCMMRFETKGTTKDHVVLEKDGPGIKFEGTRSCSRGTKTLL